MPLVGSLHHPKPVILHLGDPIQNHRVIYSRLESQFEFTNPAPSELERSAFIGHLRDRTWGDFSAIMRPFWNTGGEMGRWDREIIDLLPATVKVYASAGAGYDWVDTEALADHGILYCNARGASTEAVADTALFYIISVFRNMPFSQLAARSLNQEKFKEAHYDLPRTSHNPRGHSLGIIGLGDIGFASAKKVRDALGMEIMYHDIQRKPIAQEEEVQATYYERLDEMLGQSDCVLVAAPYAGKVLITAELLAKFKPGSRLVNIARGSLIDEEALADALDRRHLSGAGLDVHANEPAVNPRLANNWQVGMTSHTGGGALETWDAFEKLAMENVEQVLTGGQALTPVNGHLIKQREADEVHVNGHATDDDAGTQNDTSSDSPATHGDEASTKRLDSEESPCTTTHFDMNGTSNHASTDQSSCIPSGLELSGNMHQQTRVIGGV